MKAQEVGLKAQPKAAQRKKTFRRLDANRDGHLTRSELMKGPQTPGTP